MEQSTKCTYDELYTIRKAIYSANNTELAIQVKYLNDNHYRNPHNVIGNLLVYRKEIANRYVNINLDEDEKNMLIEMFKDINKMIVNTLGLNF